MNNKIKIGNNKMKYINEYDKSKEIQFNEGLTMKENGIPINHMRGLLSHSKKMLNGKGDNYKFVKVSNLNYDVGDYEEGSDFSLNGVVSNLNKGGLKVGINPNELVNEWIGMVIHSEDGITKELLCEWLGRYGGGIDRINTFIDMINPMEVLDFDFEIIPTPTMMEIIPQLTDFMEVK